MSANLSNVDVITDTDGMEIPSCPHGPCLLFERYCQDTSSGQRFFACSAFRDRKDCSFFQWADTKVSEVKQKTREDLNKNLPSQFTHKQYRKRVLRFKKLPVSDRSMCVDCGLLLLPEEHEQHKGQGHSVRANITRQMLKEPTHLFAPLENNKTYAQYLFSQSTVDFIMTMLHKLDVTHVLCIGAPRLHEEIQKNKSTEGENLQSLLLDLDHRYMQIYPPKLFCHYNMFNHHFSNGDSSRQTFEEFLKLEQNKKVAMVMDPPFGGMVEALGAVVKRITETWTRLAHDKPDHSRKLPTFWFFPYFMEKRIRETWPNFSMLDYKVGYDNHVLFRNQHKGRKKGSPVRIFTNLQSADIPLPEDEGYWFCDKCCRYSAPENEHCDVCNSCPSKDGTTYIHCDVCDKCVKPSYVHCFTCQLCQLPTHTCGQATRAGCHICGDIGHKRRECPNKNSEHTKRKRKGSFVQKRNKKQKVVEKS